MGQLAELWRKVKFSDIEGIKSPPAQKSLKKALDLVLESRVYT
jgi:hypothetical protein